MKCQNHSEFSLGGEKYLLFILVCVFDTNAVVRFSSVNASKTEIITKRKEDQRFQKPLWKGAAIG